jgi:hypothetical protein
VTPEYIAATRTSYDAVAAAFAEQLHAATPARASAANPGPAHAARTGRPRVWDVMPVMPG